MGEGSGGCWGWRRGMEVRSDGLVSGIDEGEREEERDEG